MICDIGLPDGSGLDLCANIRQRSDVLFLFLTALDTEVDVITGYEMGADDYVTKPFSMSVLVSKISAMLKRTEKAVSNIVQTGKLTFYIDEKRVVKGDNAISITPTDWKLLMAFIEHPHHILSRKQLLERLWDSIRIMLMKMLLLLIFVALEKRLSLIHLILSTSRMYGAWGTSGKWSVKGNDIK